MERLQRPTGRFTWWFANKRPLHRVLLGLGCFVAIMLLFQIVYPSSRVLPFVKAGDQAIGGKSITDAQKQIDSKFKKATVTIAAQDKKTTTSFDEAGIDIAAKATAQAAAHYPFWLRLVPFSSFFIMQRNETVQIRYDDDRLAYFAKQTSKESYVAPVNASITIKDSKVELVPAKSSKSYPEKNIISAIKKAHLSPKSVVTVAPTVKAAERTDKEVQGVLKEAQKAVDTPLTLDIGSEKITVPKDAIASWLDFPEDPETKKLHLAVKADPVKKYLNSVQSKVYKAPGVTKVQLVDGAEVSRTVGESGKGVDIPRTTTMINDALLDGKEVTLNVPIAALAPTISYDRQYSNTSAGLEALLQDIAGSKGLGVSVAGSKTASANGSKQFTAASTYKLYVAYAVSKAMEAGTMQWTDVIDGGRTADVCYNDMIVKSDNPCSKAFAQKIGWGNIQNQMVGLGLRNTSLNSSPLLTSANDLALFLTKLNNGSLLSGGEQTRLIDAMKRQVYRSGIPAGVGGASVADKVGFIDNVIHDAGIVYGAKGPYVMVIMTSNSSWGTIANVASQINTFMNR